MNSSRPMYSSNNRSSHHQSIGQTIMCNDKNNSHHKHHDNDSHILQKVHLTKRPQHDNVEGSGAFKKRVSLPRGISTRNNSMYKWQGSMSSMATSSSSVSNKNDDYTTNSNDRGRNYVVVGALEVESQPRLDYHSELKPLDAVKGYEDEFRRDCIERIWEGMNLHDTFVNACESMPVDTICCGKITNDDKMKQNLCIGLNNYWCAHVNKKLQKIHHHGDENIGDVQKNTNLETYKIDAYLWTWSNIAGSSEEKVLLIRFHKLLN